MVSLKSFILLNILLACTSVMSQNTIGTVLNTALSSAGYTLITPNSDVLPSTTYLIDNCGNIVNSWVSDFKGQGSDKLMEDGSLFRASFDDQSTLDYAGNNGRLEHFDWEGNLLWGITLSETDFSFHHDYTVLANGNILLLVAERMTENEAILAGRNPQNLIQNELYTEKILEIQPVGSNDYNIIWEWDAWDHLVQDFDPLQNNFGNVSESPFSIDINFIGFSNDRADWLHLNSIDYNSTLDHILISSRFTSEIYILDHSTTTEEAASNSGGNSGRGGDILYRWGNPQAYERGQSQNQMLFGQHTAHWIPEGFANEGQIMVFNNGFTRGYSTVDIIDVPALGDDGTYPLGTPDPYLPEVADIIYQTDPLQDFFAPFLSSAYTLENGNILVNDGPVGQLREIQPNTGQKVWEYISPVTITNGTLSQGDPPASILSRFFRASRYAFDFEGFEGRDLTPGLPIELNPAPENCELLLSLPAIATPTIALFPNPVKDILRINTSLNAPQFTVYDLQGKIIVRSRKKLLNVSALPNGIYLLRTTSGAASIVERFIKI